MTVAEITKDLAQYPPEFEVVSEDLGKIISTSTVPCGDTRLVVLWEE
jgi:hypothetical protein